MNVALVESMMQCVRAVPFPVSEWTGPAVVLNVTAVDQSAAGFFIVYPTGVARPLASNLNFVAHVTVPNLVTVGLGSGGQVTIFVAGERFDLASGDVLAFPGNVPHSYQNPDPHAGAHGVSVVILAKAGV